MANFTTATSDDCETVANLTKSIATLTDRLKAKDIWAKSQEAELKHLLVLIFPPDINPNGHYPP
jgi:hypothetical protein